MRFIAVATMQFLVVLGTAWPVSAQEVRTQRFEGFGSRAVGSDVEFFVVEGTYRHTLDGANDCTLTASVFPGPQQPSVVLSDVIDADLEVFDEVAADDFSITKRGWVNLQIGTGPDCSWRYTVTGAFLPLGGEPKPPNRELIGWWPVALAAGGAALLTWGGIRKRVRVDAAESKVQVAEPPD